MGTFSVTIGVGHLEGGDLIEVSAMVDTGAAHTMAPKSLLEQLSVPPIESDLFTLADGSEVEYHIGAARIDIKGRQWPCLVIFGPEDEYLLGATTLENFGLMVDPESERLVRKQYRARSI